MGREGKAWEGGGGRVGKEWEGEKKWDKRKREGRIKGGWVGGRGKECRVRNNKCRPQ